MFVRYIRRWPNIETALGECPVFAGDRADRERLIWSQNEAHGTVASTTVCHARVW